MKNLNRRKFILQSAQTIGLLSALSSTFSGLPAEASSLPLLTVQEIIDRILKEGNLVPLQNTVDTIKFGRADQGVTGIVCTMFPTIPIIHEAAKRKANFIIAHEPSFYNHLDDKQFVPNNLVLKRKLALLDQYQMVIWRFHDNCHRLKPETMLYGVVQKAGWTPYFKPGEIVFSIPALSLEQLVQHLKRSLSIAHLRVIGDLNQECSKLAFILGAAGGQRQISLMESARPDVLVVGEISEWEAAEYLRDARAFGLKLSLIILGHSVSEEPGMAYLTDWLKPKFPSLPITHIPSEDPFTWV